MGSSRCGAATKRSARVLALVVAAVSAACGGAPSTPGAAPTTEVGESTTASESTSPEAASAPVASASSVATTSSTAPTTPAAPTSSVGSTPVDELPWAIATVDGPEPVIWFFHDDSARSVRAPGISTSCGLDLSWDRIGVEVGIAPGGGSAETLQVSWGGTAQALRPRRTNSEPTTEVTVAASTVRVERVDGAVVVAVDDRELRVDRDGQPFGAQLHGTHGTIVAIRMEPDEPACDRGVVWLVDLAAGAVLACGRTNGALELIPNATTDEVPAIPLELPDSAFFDYSACAERELSPETIGRARG